MQVQGAWKVLEPAQEHLDTPRSKWDTPTKVTEKRLEEKLEPV